MQNFYGDFCIDRMNNSEDQKVESSERTAITSLASIDNKGCAKDLAQVMLRTRGIRQVKMEDNSSKTPVPFLLILVQFSLLSLNPYSGHHNTNTIPLVYDTKCYGVTYDTPQNINVPTHAPPFHN